MSRMMWTGLIAALLAAAPLAAQKPEAAETLMQAAIKKELVDGDLNGAIKQYAAIVAKYKTDRAVTAMALVHMAECYQKMGDAESRKIYEQVVKDYADQKEAVTLARARLGAAREAGQQNARLIWSGPAYYNGVVSADGRYLSYTSRDTSDVFIHEIATGIDRRLTNRNKDSKDHADQSAISKDGRQVAYAWHHDGLYELRVASLAGDPTARRLYENPDGTEVEPGDWSPDGNWVAVELYGRERLAQIGLISTTDGSLRVLKSGQSGPARIFFSPDGKYLGYDLSVGDSGDRRDVFVLSVDGGVEISAPVHRGRDKMMGWSPDGKRLLFAREMGSSTGLWAMSFADGKFQGQAELIKADVGRISSLGVTRSGALYYYAVTGPADLLKGSNVQIASLDFATGRFLAPPRDVAPESSEPIMAPSWSPDGNYLAYISWPDKGTLHDFALVIRSAETGQRVRELQVNIRNFVTARWAPDGRSFVAPGVDSQGRAGIHRIDALTGEMSQIVVGSSATLWFPGLSPDGKMLYFSRPNSPYKENAIVQRDLASGNEKELTRRAVLNPVILSPDGRYVAAGSVDASTNSRTLLLVPTDGGEPRVIMQVAAEAARRDLATLSNGEILKGQAVFPVAWVPDSRSLIVRKRLAHEKQGDEVWLVPVSGDTPRKLDLRLDRTPLLGINLLSVHPDGRRIAYVIDGKRKDQLVNNVWVLENLLPATSVAK
jgi:Tol biopolymer transport system component